MGKIIAVFNQKGGVGKTATISCLASELQIRGKKVLVIDADQQENLSVSLRVIPRNCKMTIYDLLRKEIEGEYYERDLSEVIHHTDFGIDLIPGSVRMAGMDRLMFTVTHFPSQFEKLLENYATDKNDMRSKIEEAGLTEDIKEFIRIKRQYDDEENNIKKKLFDADLYIEKDGDFLLKKILSAIKGNYDYILIDCPPALSSITINILTAADRLIIPMTPEPFSASGMRHLLANIEVINKLNNPDLTISGLLFTMVQKNLKVSDALIEQTRARFESEMYVYDTQIPRSTDVNKAFAHSEPLILYNRNNTARKAYSDFCEEFLMREEG